MKQSLNDLYSIHQKVDSEKSVVIAGNGPSLAMIDYKRLPKKFDVFRCNQFFKEDKYYLGRKVDFYLSRNDVKYKDALSAIIHAQYGYYDIDTILCSDKIAQNSMKFYCSKFPHVYPFTDANEAEWADIFHYGFYYPNNKNSEILKEFLISYRNANPDYKPCNTGTALFIYAINEGYTDIYMVGIELTLDNWTYAFPSDKPLSREQIMPWHNLEVDKAVFEFVKSLKTINIYSIVNDSALSKIFPLAPIQNDDPHIVEDKHIANDEKQSFESYYNYLAPKLDRYYQLFNANLTNKLSTQQKLLLFTINNRIDDEIASLSSNIFTRFVFSVLKFVYHFLTFVYTLLKVVFKVLVNRSKK